MLLAAVPRRPTARPAPWTGGPRLISNLFAANNGNVTGIFNCRNGDRSQLFSYDELNRVATAQTSSNSGSYCWGESFSYDIWANLTDRTITKCEGADVPAATNKNQMATHTYD